MTTADPVDTDPTTDLGSQRADSSVSLFAEESAAPAEPGGPSVGAVGGQPGDDLPAGDRSWVTVATPERRAMGERPLSMRRVLGQLVLGVVVVLAVVTVGGSFAARRLAEREAVNDAANTADVLAEAVVQPSLSDALLDGDVDALSAFSTVVDSQVLGENVVHVKLWTPDGKVVYADEAELIGRTFDLDPDQRSALTDPTTHAEISNLQRDENALDGSLGDKLVEVYRPVWTPSGETMLFEIYAPYDQVGQRTSQLWRGFAGVTLSSLLLFLVLLAPVLLHLLSRVRREQVHRELLLQRAVDASAAERRMIAATLHDGPVQDLAATSFVVAGATARARSAGQGSLVEELHTVSASVRTSIRALRSLLVDIYPASLAQSGLAAALTDLAQSVRAPGLEVQVDLASDLHTSRDLGLDEAQERLVYRVAQETIRNAAKHAAPCTATLALHRDDEGVVLDVVDDGPGFDVEAQLVDPEPGHLGLQLLADLATTGGGLLQVASAPGAGTHWRLQLLDPSREEEPDA
jgi:signal transduction histidine kinase